jgi:hypothetical protein
VVRRVTDIRENASVRVLHLRERAGVWDASGAIIYGALVARTQCLRSVHTHYVLESYQGFRSVLPRSAGLSPGYPASSAFRTIFPVRQCEFGHPRAASSAASERARAFSGPESWRRTDKLRYEAYGANEIPRSAGLLQRPKSRSKEREHKAIIATTILHTPIIYSALAYTYMHFT